MNNPYEEMLNDLIVEAEYFDDEEDDNAISILSNGESDECIGESTDDVDEDDEDEEDDEFLSEAEEFLNI